MVTSVKTLLLSTTRFISQGGTQADGDISRPPLQFPGEYWSTFPMTYCPSIAPTKAWRWEGLPTNIVTTPSDKARGDPNQHSLDISYCLQKPYIFDKLVNGSSHIWYHLLALDQSEKKKRHPARMRKTISVLRKALSSQTFEKLTENPRAAGWIAC